MDRARRSAAPNSRIRAVRRSPVVAAPVGVAAGRLWGRSQRGGGEPASRPGATPDRVPLLSGRAPSPGALLPGTVGHWDWDLGWGRANTDAPAPTPPPLAGVPGSTRVAPGGRLRGAAPDPPAHLAPDLLGPGAAGPRRRAVSVAVAVAAGVAQPDGAEETARGLGARGVLGSRERILASADSDSGGGAEGRSGTAA